MFNSKKEVFKKLIFYSIEQKTIKGILPFLLWYKITNQPVPTHSSEIFPTTYLPSGGQNSKPKTYND